MQHDRSLIGAAAGGLATTAAHYLDAVEDAVRLQPTHLICFGFFIAVAALSLPARRVSRRELITFRARVLKVLDRADNDPNTPPGSNWLRATIPALIDRALAGKAVYVEDLDELAQLGRTSRAYRLASVGYDAFADERAYWLDLLSRWRSDLTPAPPGRVAIAPDVEPRETRRACLAVRRSAALLTQVELADKLDVSARTVRRWEAGDLEPSIAHRRRLAALLGGRPSDYEEEYA
jgi:DNA-binding XRE family transcriptional regulator